tara:strand:- start:2962 stop:3441 length:480 start_codon:yes stop_codon:yes gene_type:complete
MTLLNKESVKRVEDLLKEFNPKLSIITLNSSARTALEAASSLGCEVGAIVKSLLFRTDTSYTLFLIAGDKRASLNKIKKKLNFKDVSMATAEQVKEITGFTIGGVSPIGHIKKVSVYMDISLERFKTLFAAAGHPHCVFKITYLDLKKITNCSQIEVTE